LGDVLLEVLPLVCITLTLIILQDLAALAFRLETFVEISESSQFFTTARFCRLVFQRYLGAKREAECYKLFIEDIYFLDVETI